jgi:lipoate-protein ligase A
LEKQQNMTSLSETWRLIVDPPQPGTLNMARDEAILEAVSQNDAPPTLRLYAWEPACLSLGYAQRVRDVDQARLAAQGWHLVRRMTGGRAILHTDELTYSVTLPLTHLLAAGGIIESYRRLSAALLRAVNQIGLNANAERHTERQGERPGPVCFEVPSDYEITAGGKKLIGSAQVRRRNVLLQHGTLPLAGDVSRICEALVFPDDAARAANRLHVTQRATTLAAALGREVTWDEAATALVDAFHECFGIAFERASLSTAEQARVAQLETVYNSAAWNQRV